MKQPPPPSAADRVRAALRDEILRGKYNPMTRLPSERDLSERFGVARNTVRSALAQLEGLRLVSPRPGSGYLVENVRQNGGAELLETLVGYTDDPDVRADIIADLLLVRRQLVRAVVLRLGARVTEEDLRRFDMEVMAMQHVVNLRRTAVELAQHDFVILHELASLTNSIVMRFCLNPIARVVRSMPDLCEAMYAEPVRSVAAWGGFRSWILAGAPGGPDVALRELERADWRTLRAYRRKYPREAARNIQ